MNRASWKTYNILKNIVVHNELQISFERVTPGACYLNADSSKRPDNKLEHVSHVFQLLRKSLANFQELDHDVDSTHEAYYYFNDTTFVHIAIFKNKHSKIFVLVNDQAG